MTGERPLKIVRCEALRTALPIRPMHSMLRPSSELRVILKQLANTGGEAGEPGAAIQCLLRSDASHRWRLLLSVLATTR